MNPESPPHRTLDCRGDLCVPILPKVRRALDRMASGEILEILSADPASLEDIPAWAARADHELLASREEEGVYRFYVGKG